MNEGFTPSRKAAKKNSREMDAKFSRDEIICRRLQWVGALGGTTCGAVRLLKALTMKSTKSMKG